MDSQKLPFVTSTHITQLAKKAKCTRQYVGQIVSGKKNHKSRKAKAIFSAAKKINDVLAKVQPGVDKKFQELDAD